MIYFNTQNPNKYKTLKKLIRPHHVHKCGLRYDYERIGKGDGSYVLPRGYNINQILSYGGGGSAPFEEKLLKRGVDIHLYDGSIKKTPFNGGNFYKEFLSPFNFKEHINRLPYRNAESRCLKMDIDGDEYNWLNKKNEKLLTENFAVFCVEVHGLIQERVEGWILTEGENSAKDNPQKVLNFFKRLSSNFLIWHIHANNHGPRYVDFPDCLEITFLNKRFFEKSDSSPPSQFPIEGLDFPNYNGREDYILDWW